jgi:hypothetical protein
LKIEVKKKIDVIFDFQAGRERRKASSALKRGHEFQNILFYDEKKP